MSLKLKKVKKLVSILAISTLVTITKKEAVEPANTVKIAEIAGTNKDSESGEYPETKFAWVSNIWYPITFRKEFVLVLFNSSSKINTIYLIIAKQLRLSIRPTDVKAQQIDNIMPNIYRIVVAAFSVTNMAN